MVENFNVSNNVRVNGFVPNTNNLNNGASQQPLVANNTIPAQNTLGNDRFSPYQAPGPDANSNPMLNLQQIEYDIVASQSKVRALGEDIFIASTAEKILEKVNTSRGQRNLPSLESFSQIDNPYDMQYVEKELAKLNTPKRTERRGYTVKLADLDRLKGQEFELKLEQNRELQLMAWSNSRRESEKLNAQMNLQFLQDSNSLAKSSDG
jgi:hypothetical protein